MAKKRLTKWQRRFGAAAKACKREQRQKGTSDRALGDCMRKKLGKRKGRRKGR